MALKEVITIGSLKTLGLPLGETTDTFGSTSTHLPMTPECAELTLVPHTQLLEKITEKIFETYFLYFSLFNLLFSHHISYV